MATERKKQKQRERKRARRKNRKQKSNPLSDFHDDFAPMLSVLPLKMSEVLEDFAEPFKPAEADREMLEQFYKVVIIAWNLALMPSEERDEVLEDRLKRVQRTKNPEAEGAALELIEELIKRKLQFFDEIKRPILDFHLTEQEDDSYYLQVISGLA